MVFQPGNKLGGRPPGACGRKKLLASFDALIAKHENKEKLMAALQDMINTNPLRFIKELWLPLTLPLLKDAALDQAAIAASNLPTDSIILKMDRATVANTQGYRLRLPIMTEPPMQEPVKTVQ